MLSIIILAAGKSERMGKAKLLMPLNGETVLAQTVANYVKSGAGAEIIVVIGPRSSDMKKAVKDQGVKFAVNSEYRSGMSSSLIKGVRAVSDKSDALMIALGDQPLTSATVIKKLADEFNRSSKGIVFPTYKKERGQPTIFAIKYKEELLTLTGDMGARDVIKRHSDDTLPVAVDTDAVLVDIDTQADYQKATENLYD